MAGDTFGAKLFRRLLAEEPEKLRQASNWGVHDSPQDTTLPIARAIVAAYGTDADGLGEAAARLERALGASAFTAALARGSAINADASVAFALATIDRLLA